ncbi:SRPBCC family protein [Brevundimonas staleyi]|uniref:SRPBCC family protein n=1 Tax=Brevundimonas staleyi TaxID=74326 RepID=A0ABW0FQB9_9CAUL
MRRLLALLLLLLPLPVVAQEVTVTEAPGELVHQIVIPAPPAEVWQAVGTMEGWRTWATPLVRAVADSDRFETSYNPDAAPAGPDTIEQEWIARDAPRTVSFRTTRTPEGFPHADAYLNVVSTFELTPGGDDATHLKLVTSGYPDDAAGAALMGFFREGNRLSLQQLHQRFVDGPVDWPTRLSRP